MLSALLLNAQRPWVSESNAAIFQKCRALPSTGRDLSDGTLKAVVMEMDGARRGQSSL
jgi:hypothetical protein